VSKFVCVYIYVLEYVAIGIIKCIYADRLICVFINVYVYEYMCLYVNVYLYSRRNKPYHFLVLKKM